MNNVELAYAITALPKCWMYGHNVIFKRNEDNVLIDAKVFLDNETLLDMNGIQTFDENEFKGYRTDNSQNFRWATRMGSYPEMSLLQEAFSHIKIVTGYDLRELRKQYPAPSIDFGDGVMLSAIVALQFKEVGEEQRGHAEKAMVDLQLFMGGGVLDPVIEHAGDLIHRMTNDANYGSVQCGNIHDKCEKVLNRLESDYGFEKEFNENTFNNANYRGIDHEQFKADIFSRLKIYADEHMKLPAYNDCHLAAKKACVAIGNWDLDVAIDALTKLKEYSSERQLFTKLSTAYYGEPSGLQDRTASDPYLSRYMIKEASMDR